MRRLLIVLLVPIVLMIISVKPATSATTSAITVTPPPTVTICGTSFCVNGSTFYPYGASFYDSTSASGIVSNPAGAIALAKQQHLNTLRVVNWLPHNGPVVTAMLAATWLPVDAFIADAEKAGLRVWLDLSDFKTVLMHNCLNPYTDLNDWYQLEDYVSHRVNTVTGEKYGTDPEISWIGFLGEPSEADKYYAQVGAGDQSGSNGVNASPLPNWGMTGSECFFYLYYSTYTLTKFYSSVESRWKGEASVPTMAGGLTKLDQPSYGNIDWKSILGSPYNDICGFKTYGGMEAWLANGTAYCSGTLDKPSVNVEWGYQQNIGDSVRAADFAAQFANNKAAGMAGNFYWNAGYQAGGYDVDDGTISPLTFQEVVANAHPLAPTTAPAATPAAVPARRPL